MLEIQEQVSNVKVKIKGVEYALTAPTAGDLEDMEASLAGGAGQVKTVIEFLVSLGLPRDVVRSLTSDQMRLIVDTVSGTKKN